MDRVEEGIVVANKCSERGAGMNADSLGWVIASGGLRLILHPRLASQGV